MARWSTEPLIEMSTKNLPGGKVRSEAKVHSLTAICEPIVWENMGAFNILQPYGPPRHDTGIANLVYVVYLCVC
jgi:hypothetical protein